MHQKDRPVPPDVPFLVKGPSFAAGMPEEPEVARFRTAIDDAGALAFFDYWIEKCGADDIPGKAQIDPIEIPKLLSAMFIEEWDPSAGQSRIRLAGEFHREPDGSNIQDRTIDELANGETAVRPSAPMTWTTSTSPSCATPTSPCPCAIRTRQSWSTAIPGCCRTRPSRRRAGRQILAPITTSGRDVHAHADPALIVQDICETVAV
jgi:hypothetical protein